MITEPTLIIGESISDAWRGAAQLIVDGGDRFNLTVHVRNAIPIDESLLQSLDPKRVRSETKSLFDVANTIFPRGRNYEEAEPSEFFAHYADVYTRGKRRTPSAWGTYFQRLVEFGKGGPNQLQVILDCMKSWGSKPRAAYVLHLSGSHIDKPRPLGAPCWQFGQFIRSDTNTLSLSVAYRSHDYFEKALGNFLGLARLLEFVCKHTNQAPGSLTCLSTYAHLGKRKMQTIQLLGSKK